MKMGEFNQRKYINEYIRENYDRITLRLPLGLRDVLKKQAVEKGYPSVNAYIIALIEQDR